MKTSHEREQPALRELPVLFNVPMDGNEIEDEAWTLPLHNMAQAATEIKCHPPWGDPWPLSLRAHSAGRVAAP